MHVGGSGTRRVHEGADSDPPSCFSVAAPKPLGEVKSFEVSDAVQNKIVSLIFFITKIGSIEAVPGTCKVKVSSLGSKFSPGIVIIICNFRLLYNVGTWQNTPFFTPNRHLFFLFRHISIDFVTLAFVWNRDSLFRQSWKYTLFTANRYFFI